MFEIQVSRRSLLAPYLGDVIFNLETLLLVAAISVGGVAVAFPAGADLEWEVG